jgi:hypothetical protein
VDGGHPGAGHIADHLRGLAGGEVDREAHDEAVAGQDEREQRRPRGLGRRVGQRGHEDQDEEYGCRQRQAGHDGDDDHPEQVARDHDIPVRMPLGDRGEKRSTNQPGEVTYREGGGRHGDRLGLAVDQHRDGGAGQVVAEPGQSAGNVDRPVLGLAEHLTERGLPFGGACLVGHRGASIVRRQTICGGEAGERQLDGKARSS